jgi:hypothetical protein
VTAPHPPERQRARAARMYPFPPVNLLRLRESREGRRDRCCREQWRGKSGRRRPGSRAPGATAAVSFGSEEAGTGSRAEAGGGTDGATGGSRVDATGGSRAGAVAVISTISISSKPSAAAVAPLAPAPAAWVWLSDKIADMRVRSLSTRTASHGRRGDRIAVLSVG